MHEEHDLQAVPAGADVCVYQWLDWDKLPAWPGMTSCTIGYGPSFLLLQRSPLTYFRSGWHVVDFVSVVLLFTAAILWIDFVIRMANPFDIELRQGPIFKIMLPDVRVHLPVAALFV